MVSDNIKFMNDVGGTAFNRCGYDIRKVSNTQIPYNSDYPEEGGKCVKNHITIINPKNSEHYKSITEYEDGTIVSHLSKWDTGEEPFSRTRVKGRDGKWYLLEYRNVFFGWQNSELLQRGKKTIDDIKEAEELSPKEQTKLLRHINAPIAPCNKVVLKNDIYPELCEIKQYAQNVDIDCQYLGMFPERAEQTIQKNFPMRGVTNKEAEALVDIYAQNIRQFAEETLARGKRLLELGDSCLNALKKHL